MDELNETSLLYYLLTNLRIYEKHAGAETWKTYNVYRALEAFVPSSLQLLLTLNGSY